MEDVLEVYALPYDPQRPVVCMDETNKQLLADTREPLPMEPGQVECIDHEYARQGVANLFMFSEPLVGQRHVRVTDRRTSQDWAEAMRELADVCYPDVNTIIVVLDNLNTHDPASFYAAFPPEEAQRLAKRFEFHFTPKHGSWLNMAEIEHWRLWCFAQCVVWCGVRSAHGQRTLIESVLIIPKGCPTQVGRALLLPGASSSARMAAVGGHEGRPARAVRHSGVIETAIRRKR